MWLLIFRSHKNASIILFLIFFSTLALFLFCSRVASELKCAVVPSKDHKSTRKQFISRAAAAPLAKTIHDFRLEINLPVLCVFPAQPAHIQRVHTFSLCGYALHAVRLRCISLLGLACIPINKKQTHCSTHTFECNSTPTEYMRYLSRLK